MVSTLIVYLLADSLLQKKDLNPRVTSEVYSDRPFEGSPEKDCFGISD